MANIQLNLSDKAELALLEVERISMINGIKTTKVERVNKSIEWIGQFLKFLDKESIQQIINVKIS